MIDVDDISNAEVGRMIRRIVEADLSVTVWGSWDDRTDATLACVRIGQGDHVTRSTLYAALRTALEQMRDDPETGLDLLDEQPGCDPR